MEAQGNRKPCPRSHGESTEACKHIPLWTCQPAARSGQGRAGRGTYPQVTHGRGTKGGILDRRRVWFSLTPTDLQVPSPPEPSARSHLRTQPRGPPPPHRT